MASSQQLADFVSVSCGASVEDANKFLAMTDYNLEQALNLFFSSNDSNNTSIAKPDPPSNSSPCQLTTDNDYGFIYDDDDDDEDVRPAIPAKRQRLYEQSSGQFLPGVLTAQKDKPVTSVFATGKSRGASAKQELLAKMYAPPHDVMFLGNFEELRHYAKCNNKWILVNIQKEDEFSTHILNRDVWSDNSVKELLKAVFVFWQKHDTTSSAMDFFQKYRIETTDDSYPFIAIIDPVTKSLVKTLKHNGNVPESCKVLYNYCPMFLS